MGHVKQATCKKCGETFELTSTHKGFANICDPSCGIEKPREVYTPELNPARRNRISKFAKRNRKPISPEQAEAQLASAMRGMVKLLGTLDPQFAPLVQSLCGKRFNRHVNSLRNIAKAGR